MHELANSLHFQSSNFVVCRWVMIDAWCLALDAWCLMLDARCLMLEWWCSMLDAWCLLLDSCVVVPGSWLMAQDLDWGQSQGTEHAWALAPFLAIGHRPGALNYEPSGMHPASSIKLSHLGKRNIRSIRFPQPQENYRKILEKSWKLIGKL